ncbi:unnamed protein product [Dibothriocephalus latus]|uniref:Uncharacterized protein n=1 Tax=Dibothriocephalus latus TaxID=60516 RepID=A0A3P6PRM8_DIBLA|nr:unnamed protein product [Dibothriocephalus latus]
MSYGTRGHLQKHYHSRQHLTRLCVNLRYDEAAMDIKSLPPNFLRSLTVDENTGMLSKTEVDKIAKFKEEQNNKKSPTAPASHMSC